MTHTLKRIYLAQKHISLRYSLRGGRVISIFVFFPHTHYSLPIFHVITAKRRVKLDVLSAFLKYILLFVRWCFILIYSRIVIVQNLFLVY